MGTKYEVDNSGNVTITGNLTVDTTTFAVDSSNNRVGVGTNAPAYDFEVANGKTIKLSNSTGVLHAASGVVSAGNVNLATEVGSSVLPVANGGTGSSTLGAAGNYNEIVRVNADGTALESTNKLAPSGDIVGTTDSQTLSNKTIATTLANNFAIGDATAAIVSISSNTNSATEGIIRYNATPGINAWQYSNDGGVIYKDIGSGGGSSEALKVTQHAPTANLTVDVAAGTYIKSTGVAAIDYAGGTSPAFTAPTANPRKDLLWIDDSGVLGITQGIEDASPVAPDYPSDRIVLAEILLTVGMTQILNTNIRDVRPFINLGGGSSAVQYQEEYIVGTPLNKYTGDDSVFTLSNDYVMGSNSLHVYYDGVLMRPGAAYDYQETAVNQVTFNSARTTGHRVTFRWLRAAVQQNVTAIENVVDYTVGTAAAPYTGSLNTFALPYTFTPDGKNLEVYYDGVRMRAGYEYNETSNSVIQFISDRTVGHSVSFKWTAGALIPSTTTTQNRQDFVATANQQVFTLNQPYIMNGKNLQVYQGALLKPGVDYTESSNYTITFPSGTFAGGELVSCLWQSNVSAVPAQYNDFRDNRVAVAGEQNFTLPYAYIMGGSNLIVTVGGVVMTAGGVDYNEVDPTHISFVTPMSGGERISFIYKISPPSGDAMTVGGYSVNATPTANNLLPLDGNAKIADSALNGVTAKAWVHFNGATGTIYGQYNVSSITINATGDYTVNFTTPMIDTNYAVASIGYHNPNVTEGPVDELYNARGTTGVRIQFRGNAGYVAYRISAVIFR